MAEQGGHMAKARPLTKRYVWAVSGLMLTTHFVALAAFANYKKQALDAPLGYWDASWYVGISQHGYSMPSWAFYPLYPLLMRTAAQILPRSMPMRITGCLLSSLFFILFTWLIASWVTSPHRRLAALAPATRTGWLCFCAAPAAYIFNTCHTEALFVLLTAATLTLERTRRWPLAALTAGLCAVTRNQGVILAVCTAVSCCIDQKTPRRKLAVFLGVSAISLLVFSLYPLYQFLKCGDPLAFVHAQYHWRPEMTAASYMRTFWFGNPWQVVNFVSMVRHLFFAVLILLTARLFVCKYELTAALFVCGCLAMMPVSGELLADFRYSLVLFPLYFRLGDDLDRWPLGGRMALVATLMMTHIVNSFQYLLGAWAY